MERNEFLTALVVTLSLSMFACAGQVSKARISREDEVVVDLGIVDPSAGDRTVDLAWTNRTGKTATISRIIPACKCVTVEASKKKVNDGEEVSFRAIVDFQGIVGPGGSGFLVSFKEKIEPAYFNIAFEVPTPPTAKPATLDFGRVFKSASRLVQITMATERDGAFTVETPKTFPGPLSWTVDSSKSRIMRNANSQSDYRYHRIDIKLTYVSTQQGGKRVGEMAIPVYVNGLKKTVAVPYRAHETGEIYPQTDRVTVFIGNNSKKTTERSCKFFSAKDSQLSSLSAVTASSRNKDVAVSWQNAQQNGPFLGTLTMKLDRKAALEDPKENVVDLHFDFSSEKKKFALPFTILSSENFEGVTSR